jgi:hypothetical protein
LVLFIFTFKTTTKHTYRREQKFYDDYGFLVQETFVEEYKKFYETKQKNRNMKIDLKWKDVLLPPHNWYEKRKNNEENKKEQKNKCTNKETNK